MQKLVSFFLLFCLILIAVGLVAALIHTLLKIVFLGWVNRTFGVIFGAAKGILITTVLFIVITSFVPNGSNHMQASRTAPYLAQVADALTLFISRNIKTDFSNELEGLKKTWKHVITSYSIHYTKLYEDGTHDLKTVHDRHSQRRDDRVHFFPEKQIQACMTVFCRKNPVSLILEQNSQAFSDGDLIVYDEKRFLMHSYNLFTGADSPVSD